VAAYAGLSPEQIIIGVDGCGVPVFAMPLQSMALAYCRLTNTRTLPPPRASAARRITAAIGHYPRMIAGEGQFCSELVAATQGRIIGKLGADGVYCAAPLDGSLGIALKIEDGNSAMLPIVMMSVLTQLDLLTATETERLINFSRHDNINCKREKVGETRAVFRLGC
jgi:L-asparaginase II